MRKVKYTDYYDDCDINSDKYDLESGGNNVNGPTEHTPLLLSERSEMLSCMKIYMSRLLGVSANFGNMVYESSADCMISLLEVPSAFCYTTWNMAKVYTNEHAISVYLLLLFMTFTSGTMTGVLGGAESGENFFFRHCASNMHSPPPAEASTFLWISMASTAIVSILALRAAFSFSRDFTLRFIPAMLLASSVLGFGLFASVVKIVQFENEADELGYPISCNTYLTFYPALFGLCWPITFAMILAPCLLTAKASLIQSRALPLPVTSGPSSSSQVIAVAAALPPQPTAPVRVDAKPFLSAAPTVHSVSLPSATLPVPTKKTEIERALIDRARELNITVKELQEQLLAQGQTQKDAFQFSDPISFVFIIQPTQYIVQDSTGNRFSQVYDASTTLTIGRDEPISQGRIINGPIVATSIQQAMIHIIWNYQPKVVAEPVSQKRNSVTFA